MKKRVSLQPVSSHSACKHISSRWLTQAIFYVSLALGWLSGQAPALAQAPPAAQAGPDQFVLEGSQVTLDGSGSSDPNPGLLEPNSQSGNLPGGTALQVSIDSLGPDASLQGQASIGEGPSVAQTAIAYVVDVSGSANFTGGCGGDQNNDNLVNRIIDCEIAAALELHEEVIASGTVAEVGLVIFSSGAAARDLNPLGGVAHFLIAPDADADANGVIDFEQTLRTLRAGGATNFRAAAQTACNLLSGSVASNRLAVFISDGQATTGGSTITILPCNPPVRFETFAIGSGSSCTLGAAGSRLQEIADATGGRCTNVPDVGNLPDILPEVIGVRITHAELRIDGGAPIDISDRFAPPLPAAGPASLAYALTLPPLPDGVYEVCVSIFAEDFAGSGAVTSCSRLRVGDAPLSYQWTLLDGDGPPIVLSSGTDPQPSFQVADDGVYLFELTVTNGFGLSSTDRVRVEVNNAEPQLSLDPGQGFAGGVTLLNASFTDQGYIDTHSATLDWGDGTVEEVPISVQGLGWGGLFGSHIYAAPGEYDVVLTLSDDDGGVSTQILSGFQIAEAVAVWANSASAARTLNWSGAGGQITGRVHSNNELRFTGQTKTVIGGATYAGLLSADTNKHIFSQEPVLAPVQDYPLRFDIADYRPGGAVAIAVGAAYFDKTAECRNGFWHETQTVLPAGVYYADCDIQLNGSAIGGRVTVVAEDTLHVYGSRPAFEPYYDGLLFLSGSAADKAIDIAASYSKFLGVVFSESGEIDISGAENRFFCGILGDRIDLLGGNLELRGASCGRPDSTVAGPLLVPDLELTLTATLAEVLPGDTVQFDVQLGNSGAMLVVPGLLGLENVGIAAATVKAYSYQLDYFSLDTHEWLSFASAAAATSGYTPLEPLPTLDNIELSLRANSAPGVSFGSGADPILDTVIGPDGFATWGAQAVVSLDPTLVDTLLDPAQTGGIRNRVSFELDPTSVQVRRLFTLGTDFVDDLQALSGDLRDVEITLTQPTGDPVFFADTPELANIAPGAGVSLTHSYQVPVLAARSAGETDAAYITRLQNADRSLLYGSAAVRAQGGVGLLVSPLRLAAASEHVPVVSLSSSGPDFALPGAQLDYQLITRNLGAAEALNVLADSTVDGQAVTPTPTVPAVLAAGQVINARLSQPVAANRSAGTLLNLNTVNWEDAHGNAYGPVEAQVTTAIGEPPAIVSTLRDNLLVDADGNGLVSPGDTLRYQAVVANGGDLPLSGVVFALAIDSNASLLNGSVSSDSGTVSSGNGPGDSAVTVDIGVLAARSETAIQFDVLIIQPLPDGVVSLAMQGTIASNELDPALTDDPDVFGVDDITITRIAVPYPVLVALLSVELIGDSDGNGAASAGDRLRYRLELSNAGTAAADNVHLEIPVPTGATLLANSLQAGLGTINSGLSATDRLVDISIASLAADSSATFQFDVSVDNPPPAGQTRLTTRAMLSADGLPAVLSDDPATPDENDATVLALAGAGGGGIGGSGDGSGDDGAGDGSLDGDNGLPAPELTAISPANDATLSEPVTISATLTPPAGETVVRWTVYYRPLGSTTLTEIGSGSGPIVSAAFDPTLVPNGLYGIVIESESSNGGIARSESFVNVEGNLKPGRFSLTFEDLNVSIGKLPLSVKRRYDSFDTRPGDFGHGWRLETADFKIQSNGFLGAGGWRQEVVSTSLFLAILGYQTDKPHFVTVTWPDGTVEVFDLVPTDSVNLFSFLSSAEFKARLGSTSTLEALDSSLFFNGDGNLYGGLFGIDGIYNPTRFRLTDRFGTEYIIDKHRGLLQSRDLNGNTLTINDNGIFHSLGPAVVFQRDAQNRITRITDPAGNHVLYDYDAAGDLVATTDQAGQRTTYTYYASPAHYLNEVIDPLGRMAQRTEYDANGRVVATIDALGNRIEQDYDPTALILRETDRRGFVTEFVYNKRGNVIEQRDPQGGVTRYRYDDPNHPDKATSVTDPNGNTTTYTLDEQGNILTVAEPDGAVTRYSYDAAGRVTRIENALGNAQTMAYDQRGNLIRFVDEAGQATVVTYDDQGRVLTAQDPAGNVTRLVYAGGALPSELINPDGSRRRFEYNGLGQVTRMTDEDGRDTFLEYDGVGNLIALRDQTGNRIAHTYSNGNLVRVDNPDGGVIRFEYDDNGRLAREIDAEGGITEYGYDAGDNRISVTDPLGNVTRFVYDGNGRLSEEIDPLGNAQRFAYDAAGNLSRITDRKGRVREFAYDAVGNLVQARWLDAAGNAVRTINANYDLAGNLVAVDSPDSAYTFAYDAANRVVQATDGLAPGGPLVLHYSYDPSGNIASVSDNRGVTVNSRYDARRALLERSWQGAPIDSARLEFDYDGFGQLSAVRRFAAGNVAAGDSSYQRDYARRITAIRHRDPAAGVLAQFDYDYDAMSRVAREVRLSGAIDYSYDLNDQLTAALGAAQNDEFYDYDAGGNRAGPALQIGPGNRLLADGEFSYDYDREGNLTQKTDLTSGELTEFAYDHRNRLVGAVQRAADGRVLREAAYAYDAFNRRVLHLSDGDGDGPLPAETTQYVYSGANVWADFDLAGAEVGRYLFGNRIDQPLVRHRPGEGLAYYLSDAIGTVRALTDASGALIDRVEYDSFGQVLSETGAEAGDRYKFAGREYDPLFDLYYFRARYYDPASGRFVSPDPLGFEGGDTNLYRYAFNSPPNFADPFGTTVFSESAIQARFAAARAAIIRCLGEAVLLDLAQTAVYVLLTEVYMKPPGTPGAGTKANVYVGQAQHYELRFLQHKGSGVGGRGLGFKPVGLFNVNLSIVGDEKAQKRALRLIEQLIMDAFGGKTELVNTINAASPKKFKRLKDIFCLK